MNMGVLLFALGGVFFFVVPLERKVVCFDLRNNGLNFGSCTTSPTYKARFLSEI